MDADRATWRLDQMRAAFPAAQVSDEAIARLEPAMTNDEKDRHVLAAAVAASVDALVTFNIAHFPDDACSPHNIEVMGPDDFLLMLHDLDRTTVDAVIGDQAAALRNPPISCNELKAHLARAGVPRFAARL